MLQDLLLSLFTALVVQPFTATAERHLAAAGAPTAVIQDMRACAAEAGPALATRAVAEPGWALLSVSQVLLGLKPAVDVVAGAGPTCDRAAAAVRPLLAAQG
jgi:hypothetical protein